MQTTNLGYTAPIYQAFYDQWYSRLAEVDSSYGQPLNRQPIVTFAEDIISLLTTPINEIDSLPQLMFTRRLVSDITEMLRHMEMDEDGVVMGLKCLTARMNRTEKVRNFSSALMRYDIPLGQSPETKSDSLLRLLENGKTMCLAPLAVGGTLGAGQLQQGQYVAALLSTLEGSAITLIMLGTMAIGSLLISRVAQQRSRRRTPHPH